MSVVQKMWLVGMYKSGSVTSISETSLVAHSIRLLLIHQSFSSVKDTGKNNYFHTTCLHVFYILRRQNSDFIFLHT